MSIFRGSFAKSISELFATYQKLGTVYFLQFKKNSENAPSLLLFNNLARGFG